MLWRIFLAAVVIVLFYFGYKSSDKAKRKKLRSGKNTKVLKPRKVGIIKEYETYNTKDLLKRIIKSMDGYTPHVAHVTNDEAIIYTSDAGQTKYYGLVNTPDEKLPVRIVLKIKNDTLIVQLDEDHGSQIFVGTARKIFREKYNNAFNHYLNIIEASLDRPGQDH